MTSTIFDAIKSGFRAETAHADLIGNSINENGQISALSLDKLLDLLSSKFDGLDADAYNERVSKLIDDFGKKASDDKGGWGDVSVTEKTGTAATKADLQSSTELSSIKTAGVTDAVAGTQPTTTAVESPAARSVEAAAAAPAAAAATSTGFPDASTTGVPAGTSLTTYTGPMTISKAGTVIENQIINGSLRITAADVVIKNCVIKYNGTWGIDAEGAKNVTVQNCDITGAGTSGTSNAGILGSGKFIGNDISKSENGIVLQNGASTVKGNYVHDLQAAGSDPHYDGISVQGGQNGVLIEGNTIVGRDTSDVFIKNDFGPIANVKVTGNLLLGDSGYPVYVDGRASGGAITGVSITNNHIEKGYYGYYNIENSNPTVSGNTEYPQGGAPEPGDGTVSPTPEPEPTPTPDTTVYNGTAGNDVMPRSGQANGGSETLNGRDGNDTLKGGAGADHLNGGEGRDTATYSGSSKAVEVSLRSGTGEGGHAQGDRLSGIENLTGSSHNDTLKGNSGNNVLKGGLGADKMMGGGGNDTYGVNSAWDKVIETSGNGHDVVKASASYKLGGSIEDLRLSGNHDLKGTGNGKANDIVGNSGDNVLSGGGGSDDIKGGSGNDTLTGGTGYDKLTGGGGADRFVFRQESLKSDQPDHITDFASNDLIRFDVTSGHTGALADSAFRLGTHAVDSKDRFIFDKKSDALYYDRDGSGSAAQVKVATFDNGHTVSADDIWLF